MSFNCEIAIGQGPFALSFHGIHQSLQAGHVIARACPAQVVPCILEPFGGNTGTGGIVVGRRVFGILFGGDDEDFVSLGRLLGVAVGKGDHLMETQYYGMGVDGFSALLQGVAV